MGGIEKSAEGSDYEDTKSPARFRSLTRYSRLIFLSSAMAGLLLAVYQIMGLHTLTGLAVLENSYLYLLLALFLSNVFLLRRREKFLVQLTWKKMLEQISTMLLKWPIFLQMNLT